MPKIRTAVVGVGSLGQHHARIVYEHPEADLEAIVDTEIKRREKLSVLYKAEPLVDYKELEGKIDAAIISVPTPQHYIVASFLLNAGIHCLVEKPFTSTVAEAEQLIALAAKKNLILQVGHVERFNPAIIAAKPFINKPKFAEVYRLGPYDPRTSHIGVVLDLMIHDIDILLMLVNDKVIELEAHGAKVLSQNEDIAKVRLKFANGCIADLSASRISLEKYRKIRIFQPDSYISLDYAGKTLKIFKKKSEVVKALSDIEVIKPKIKDKEPLFFELDHFFSCIKKGKKPSVSGEHGRDALELALEILKNLKF